MTNHCDKCVICGECGEHVEHTDFHGIWECRPAGRRAAEERAMLFSQALESATATISPASVVHDVKCPTVSAHITWAPRTGPNWHAWSTTADRVVIGKSCRLCSPPVTIQAKPRQLIRRLTGLGWPDDDGRCAKGHLPRWAKAKP